MKQARTIPIADPEVQTRMSDLIMALSEALDLSEGRPPGHTQRACLLGMRLGRTLVLPQKDLCDLYYALLIKDAGCTSEVMRTARLLRETDLQLSSDTHASELTGKLGAVLSAAKHAALGGNWIERIESLVQLVRQMDEPDEPLVCLRAARGAEIGQALGLSAGTCQAIRHIDERYDGGGYPDRLKGEAIPLLSRIISLAQTVEVFASLHGTREALEMACRRRGSWFDPILVDLLVSLRDSESLYDDLDPARPGVRDRVLVEEPMEHVWIADDRQLDRVTRAFAGVVDAKSSFTAEHSVRVAWAATRIAQTFGHSEQECAEIHRAALLHDIGKLGVAQRTLDKPGKLNDAEWVAIRRHPAYSLRILDRTRCLRHLALVAACHHERLNGQGYHLGLDESMLPWGSRIIAVADIFDALSADRPYHPGRPRQRVLAMLREERDRGRICPVSYEALEHALEHLDYDPYAQPDAALSSDPQGPACERRWDDQEKQVHDGEPGTKGELVQAPVYANL